MKAVYLENNTVREIIPSYALPVGKFYGTEFASHCVEAPDEVEQGWLYLNGEWFNGPIVDLFEAKSAKVSELRDSCNRTIVDGIDVQLGSSTEHFNYSEKDQLNIKEMFDAIKMGATMYPYQSENGSCRVYSADEIITIYQALAGHKTGNLTYYHQLKAYTESLENVEEVQSVYYGQELTGEYLAHYNEMMSVAQQQMGMVSKPA